MRKGWPYTQHSFKTTNLLRMPPRLIVLTCFSFRRLTCHGEHESVFVLRRCVFWQQGTSPCSRRWLDVIKGHRCGSCAHPDKATLATRGTCGRAPSLSNTGYTWATNTQSSVPNRREEHPHLRPVRGQDDVMWASSQWRRGWRNLRTDLQMAYSAKELGFRGNLLI